MENYKCSKKSFVWFKREGKKGCDIWFNKRLKFYSYLGINKNNTCWEKIRILSLLQYSYESTRKTSKNSYFYFQQKDQ